MYFGSAYYPEHLKRDMIEKDAILMKEAGLNLVRMGEFAWVKMETDDSSFDFFWLDEAIAKLAQYGIKTLLCTPTAAPPKWLTDKHRDIFQLYEDGRIREFGKRRHYCVNNRNYHFYTGRIVRALAEHYKNNPHVIGYQLDNEFMSENPYCHCSICEGGFRTWLRHKYETVNQLNKGWGTTFWSQCYRNWEEIVIPKHDQNPSAVLDYYRFFSDSFIAYAKLQTDVLKSVSPEKTVTHNICSSGFLYKMDLYKLGKILDIASVDNYPTGWTMEAEYGNYKNIPYNPAVASFALSITRGVKNDLFWVTEAQAGPPGGTTLGEALEPGRIRLFTHQEVAHGARLVSYFPWRGCPAGVEQLLMGVVDYDSVPRRRYGEIQKTIKEINDLMDEISDARTQAEVAIIRDFECDWAFEACPHNPEFKYMQHIFMYYQAFFSNHIQADIVSPAGDLSGYRMVIVPSLLMMNEERAARLRTFAENGGTLIITCLSGLRDMENVITRETLPGKIRELTGVKIEEQEGLEEGGHVFLRPLEEGFRSDRYACTVWNDVINSGTARILAVYEGCFYSGLPVITKNDFGCGKVYYVGAIPEASFLQEFTGMAAVDAGIRQTAVCKSRDVETVDMVRDGTRYVYVMNFGVEVQDVTLSGRFTNLTDGMEVEGGIRMDAMDAVVLKEII